MGVKKIAFFGCKHTTRFLVESIISKYKIANIITVSPEKNKKIIIPDYCDLKKTFGDSVDVYQVNRYDLKDKSDIQTIKDFNIDIAFCIGWQRLIPAEILSSVSIGVFGMHGSSQNLPKGRGRSPMNWSIIENRKIFYTNLFKYKPGVDDGDILDTIKFRITNQDNAETMHFKNMLAMKHIISRKMKSLNQGTFRLKKQKELEPTYYPKREPEDSQIDWSVNIEIIERLTRAVSKPFNGSFTFLKKEKFTIYEAQIFDKHQFKYDDCKNGQIVEIFNEEKFLIKCNGGLLLVKNFKCNIQIKENDLFETDYSSLKIFKKNNLGFFDLIN